MNERVKPFRAHGGLDGSLYHLLKRVARLAADIHSSRAGEGGLTQRQFAVLSCLSDNEGASQTLLVHETGIDRSTLAELAARLEARGFIRRESSPRDRRAKELHLTRKGRQALKSMEPLMAEVDRTLLLMLSPETREVFYEALKLLASEEASGRLLKGEDALRARRERGAPARREAVAAKLPLLRRAKPREDIFEDAAPRN